MISDSSTAILLMVTTMVHLITLAIMITVGYRFSDDGYYGQSTLYDNDPKSRLATTFSCLAS